jgi:RNA polymerase sigma-70 factor (ECF subfamily)
VTTVAVTKPSRSFVYSSGVPRPRDDRKDRQLFGDLAAGGRQALGELYDRHAASLFRHALALTRRSPDAEDLVQAVFVKLATTGAALLGVRAPASYMHRMLRTTWLDARRRTTVAERGLEGATIGFIEAQSEAPDEAIDIARALDTLPPQQREVIVLHLVEGCSFREVGGLTGVSLFTAAARYRLAVARLRKLLAQSDRNGI